MDHFLITTHMHVLALMVGVIAVPLIVGLARKQLKKTSLTKEENNKLRLDVAVAIPVGVLLWNLSIFYLVNIMLPTVVSANSPGQNVVAALTFEKAVAAAGEATVALATAIIFCRLFGDIWTDISKQ